MVVRAELIEVGRIVQREADDPDVWLVRDGERTKLPALGYDHFRAAGGSEGSPPR